MLGLLMEGLGLDLPIVALLYISAAQAKRPALPRAVSTLRGAGVRVLLDDGHGHGEGSSHTSPSTAELRSIPGISPSTTWTEEQQHHLGAAGKWVVTADQASYRSAMQIVVTLDCLDTETQAGFWLAALAPLDYRRGFHGPPYLSLVGPAPAPTLLLQHVPEPKQGKNRMHLDLDFGTADLVSEVDRLEQLGAERLSEELSEHGFRWIVVADPEGNEFCVFNPPNSTAVL
ncbi:VOC family protein [Streptomyces sp. NPDC003857]